MPEETKDLMVSVKVISAKGESLLVSWVVDGAEQRGFIPARKLLDGSLVAERVLSLATPYGLPWAKLVKLSATPAGVEKALHDAGIWTIEELKANPMPALGAIQRAYWLDMNILLVAAVEYLEGVK